MRNNVESFSNMLESLKWYIDRPLSNIKVNDGKIYILDLKRLINDYDKDSFLYYYPDSIKGYIQSCVLASQRQLSDDVRDVTIFKELDNAYHHFKAMEEINLAIQGLEPSVDNDKWYTDMENAVEIDILIQNTMNKIRYKYGDFAVVENSFVWTKANALLVNLRF